MNRIEKILNDRKDDLDHIEVPKDLEEKLVKALDNKKTKKRIRKGVARRIVAACLIFLLIGVNFDTLAFYGKKIIGYNQIMNGALKELNELGKGQIIDKRYRFKNGVVITIDGIMLDENQLIVFYTMEGSEENSLEMMPSLDLDGLWIDYKPRSGQGIINDEGTIIKNSHSFDPPYFFEKTMHIHFRLFENGKYEEGEISFDIDRQKAMGHTLKADIHQSIQVDQRKIQLDSILASPTQTVIKGTIQNIVVLVLDEIKDTRLRPNALELKLIANGEEVQPQGGGMGTDLKGIHFDFVYDALPANLESLKLELVRFSADHDINKIIDLKEGSKNQVFNIQGQEISINEIYVVDEKTFINITTDENTVLTKVCLLADGEVIELERTIEDDYEKLEDGKRIHTRTLEFNGTGKSYKLDIKSIAYSENYSETIEIPIE